MAARDLVRLSILPHERTADISKYYAYCQFIEEEKAFGGSSFKSRFIDLVKIPRIRRATMGGAIVMTAQQFSGINIMVSVFGSSPTRRLTIAVLLLLFDLCASWLQH